tara:strand:- start:369 stop:848 length:480 start_codon:yes stop_codon:yes gene_type:complete
MIQAITETNLTTYLQTEDNRIDTSAVSSKIRHLVKFTNDMDKSIHYVYSTVHLIYDRYTKFVFNYNSSPDRYEGTIDLKPAGYYKYEIYEVSWKGTPVIANGTAPATETDVLPVEDGNGVVQGLVTKGKMYVADKAGTAQVQYTQRQEPSGTNYIWYGQ